MSPSLQEPQAQRQERAGSHLSVALPWEGRGMGRTTMFNPQIQSVCTVTTEKSHHVFTLLFSTYYRTVESWGSPGREGP